MFDKRTVLILGAGASWHYGYPTGEGLVEDVIAAAETVAKHFDERVRIGTNLRLTPNLLNLAKMTLQTSDLNAQYRAASALCRELAERLRSVSPLVIDYFLGWNDDLAEIGRAMIAFALLKRESVGSVSVNYNRVLMAAADDVPFPHAHRFKDNWLRFVIHQLLLGCKQSERLCENQFNIITFNYDQSAERKIEEALRSTSFLKKEHVDTFLKQNRFLHMYGALKPVKLRGSDFLALDGALRPSDVADRIDRANTALNACMIASADIRVIDPHNKADGPESDQAKALIRNAERIYILGFGFDSNNFQRLGLLQPTPEPKAIFFTNLDNAMSVNKRVALALDMPAFSGPDTWTGFRNGTPKFARVDKSTRDCYEALALDFGAFEDCSNG